MAGISAPGSAEHVWRQQSVWSEVANRLKRDLQRKRDLVLGLTIAGALLSAAAVVAGLDSDAGKALAAVSAAAVGFAGLARARIGQDALQRWTRARSVAEALKSEVFLYQARVGDYARPDQDAVLDERATAVEQDAQDLVAQKSGIESRERPLPAVSDVESYMKVRVRGQIEDFYRPRARELDSRLRLARRVQGALAAAGVAVGAAAAIAEGDDVAVWLPVLTTIGASVAAYVAAERYEFLLTEYLRTADELERLRDRRGGAAAMSDEERMRAAEHVISVQNEGWMAKLNSPDGPASA